MNRLKEYKIFSLLLVILISSCFSSKKNQHFYYKGYYEAVKDIQNKKISDNKSKNKLEYSYEEYIDSCARLSDKIIGEQKNIVEQNSKMNRTIETLKEDVKNKRKIIDEYEAEIEKLKNQIKDLSNGMGNYKSVQNEKILGYESLITLLNNYNRELTEIMETLVKSDSTNRRRPSLDEFSTGADMGPYSTEVLSKDTMIIKNATGLYVKVRLKNNIFNVNADKYVIFDPEQYAFEDIEGGKYITSLYQFIGDFNYIVLRNNIPDYLIALEGGADDGECSRDFQKGFEFDTIDVLNYEKHCSCFDMDSVYQYIVPQPFGNSDLPNLRSAFIRKRLLELNPYFNEDRIYILNTHPEKIRKKDLRTVNLIIYVPKSENNSK